jgi:hypothetical protein
VNYFKLKIPSPFSPQWDQVLQLSKEKPFTVIRGNHLQLIKRKVSDVSAPQKWVKKGTTPAQKDIIPKDLK